MGAKRIEPGNRPRAIPESAKFMQWRMVSCERETFAAGALESACDMDVDDTGALLSSALNAREMIAERMCTT